MTYTDEEIRRLPIGQAKEDLLNELLATPHHVTERVLPSARHRRRLRIALSGAAAAAVAAVGAIAVVDHLGSTDDPAASAFSAKLVAKAERNPRILLDAPGWTVDTVYGFGDEEGTLRFVNGDAELELNWRPVASYNDYFQDREDNSSIGHRNTRLFGQEARLFTYSATDHATMLKPDGRSFVELRGQGMNRRVYLAVTAQLRQVGVQQFLEAMPVSVVVPGAEGEAAQKVLADIPVPPGFTFRPTGEVGDAYQFGAGVTGQVFCAWSSYYRTGDQRAKDETVEALDSSHEWKVLNDMDAEGDYPDVIWEYADRFAAGEPVSKREVEQGLGCKEWTAGP